VREEHLHCICRAATRSWNLANGWRTRDGEGRWLGHGSLASFHADDVDRELWLDRVGMGPGGINQQGKCLFPRGTTSGGNEKTEGRSRPDRVQLSSYHGTVGPLLAKRDRQPISSGPLAALPQSPGTTSASLLIHTTQNPLPSRRLRAGIEAT
jgi:hypothetical protein